eukprot:14506443-Ditylum_brightwellii.AAC.1
MNQTGTVGHTDTELHEDTTVRSARSQRKGTGANQLRQTQWEAAKHSRTGLQVNDGANQQRS